MKVYKPVYTNGSFEEKKSLEVITLKNTNTKVKFLNSSSLTTYLLKKIQSLFFFGKCYGKQMSPIILLRIQKPTKKYKCSSDAQIR